MLIPDYQTLMLPVLRLAAQRERTYKECVEEIAREFGLSPEEREQLLPSGRQTTISNRVQWAVSYMAHAGLIERPRRGVFVTTAVGREALQRNPARIDNAFLSLFESFRQFRQRSSDQATTADGGSASANDSATPEEKIEQSVLLMNTALREELIARIMNASPTFFEYLIIDLMKAMGYGGSGSLQHLGRTNDGGVDGMINEDTLGLDIVFLQAKRYKPGNPVSVREIREFAGSLDERAAVKGVFMTTSHFAQQAREYAKRSPKRLVLIDGDQLSELLVRFGVGVRTFQTFDLKKIDSDYFNTDE